MGQFVLKTLAILVAFLVLSCAPKNPASSESSGPGTLAVDAEISGGTRFVVYTNDVWSAPQRQPITAGQRKLYMFTLPFPLKTLRMDPSEALDSHVRIYSIAITLPGQPKKFLPLSDLPKFLRYHCRIVLDNDVVKIDAEGPDMYFMSTVDPASYPAAQ